MEAQKRKRYVPVMTGTVLAILMGIALIVFWQQTRIEPDVLIGQDVQKLAKIIQSIDETCGIIDIAHQKSPIDFLNIASFAGSQVGGLNLRNPEKWHGPYLKENPTAQGIFYDIVHTAQGYFVVPGTGVILSSGKVIGTDIVFDVHTDIEHLMDDKNVLFLHGVPLAAKLHNHIKKIIIPEDGD